MPKFSIPPKKNFPTVGKYTEPEALRRGKAFEKIVQEDFTRNTKDGEAESEAFVSFVEMKKIHRKSGRIDILISELGDFVTILEIKATDWDRIKPANIKKNLWSHQRQLFRYVDKFSEVDELGACLGIIYPKPPKTQGLRETIEGYLESYGVPAYWFNKI